MKKIIFFCGSLVSIVLFLFSCNSGSQYSNYRLNSKEDTASYFLGITYGSSMKEARVDSIFVHQAFMRGLNEAIERDTLPVSSYLIETYLNMYFTEIQEEQIRNQYQDYIAENETFLSDNSKKDSVVTTESGLQYVILKEGQGAIPTASDNVKVHYTGYLIDGTKFDSSYDRNEPAEFRVSEVIPGWSEVLQLMPAGSTWKVFIPADLAYGSASPEGSVIKPFSTLIFEIELLDIIAQ